MALAIFDLDNTLLAGDSDYLWGVFLSELGVVDRQYYEQENDRFYREYKEGRLDIFEFLRFSLKPLSQHEPGQLYDWRQRFLAEKIEPIITPDAQALVDKHRDAGDTLLIITATNTFVTTPIAERFGIPHLIGTDPEQADGRYTGNVAGTPSFQEGKVSRLNEWLSEQRLDMKDSWFYSDSHNDIPLLEKVDNPVAVDPDEALLEHAQQQQWPILHLHSSPPEHSNPH